MHLNTTHWSVIPFLSKSLKSLLLHSMFTGLTKKQNFSCRYLSFYGIYLAIILYYPQLKRDFYPFFFCLFYFHTLVSLWGIFQSILSFSNFPFCFLKNPLLSFDFTSTMQYITIFMYHKIVDLDQGLKTFYLNVQKINIVSCTDHSNSV